MMLALAGGFLLIFVGVFFSGPMLGLMGTPDDVLPLAALYLKIYFIGMPATLTYNFGQQSCELWAIPEDHCISCCLRVQSTWC